MDVQLTSPLQLISPLGDALRFESMGGIEGLSRLFVYEIDALSRRADIAPSELMNKPVSVRLFYGADDTALRYWNGRVTSVQYRDTGTSGWSRYRLVVRPQFWQLTLSADCRIFQHMTVPEIVRKVFHDRGLDACEEHLFGTYPAREYVVQYRESDFDFVSRLLEEVGIYYFFRHEQGKHTVVLTDSMSVHRPVTGYERIPFSGKDASADETFQCVRTWAAATQLATGVYSLGDFDFVNPRFPLFASDFAGDAPLEQSFQVYDYPGYFQSFHEGDGVARLRLEQARRDGARYSGASNARGLAVGSTFNLVDHPRADQNGKYLVTSARYRLRGTDVESVGDGRDEEPFACTFTVLDADSTFRPPRSTPKPIVGGPQTATVVGPSGQEIATDAYGRVRVQFHWDRQGKRDENSSCWVRVAQAWAGSGWGAQFIPRIDQEVIVAFLEGDPDRPIITGSVYNGANMPPFALTANQTQSGIRTRSTVGGSPDNANVIRFEDLKGSEELFVQAEKDLNANIKHDQSSTVGNDRTAQIGATDRLTVALNHLRTVGIDETVTVGAVQVTTVGAAQAVTVGAAQAVTVGADRTVTVGGSETITVGGSESLTVNRDLTRTVQGRVTATTAGDYNETVTGRTILHHQDHRVVVVSSAHGERSASLRVDGSADAQASTTISVTAKKGITITCGQSQILVLPESITFSSPTLKLVTQDLEIQTAKMAVAATDAVTLTGSTVTMASSGAKVTLDSNASVTGAQVKLGSGSGSSAQSSTKPPKMTTVVVRDPATGEPLANQVVILRFGGDGGVEQTVTLDDQGQTQVPGEDPFDVIFAHVDEVKPS